MRALAVILFVLATTLAAPSQKDKLYTLDKNRLLKNDQDVWFESLSERELEEHWSQDDGLTLAQKIKSLQGFDVTISVDVKLVGFNGEGNQKFKVEPDELRRYLDAAGSSIGTYVIKPETADEGDSQSEHGTHDLPFHTQILYQVSRVPKSFSNQIQSAINEKALEGQSQEAIIPVETVNSLLRTEFKKHSLTYTIYVLNPEHPMLPKAGERTEPEDRVVRYAYLAPTDKIPANPSDRLFGKPVCTTAVWADDQERFTWLDITAGPVSYGPQTSGDGIVTEFSTPRLEYILPQASPHAGESAADDMAKKKRQKVTLAQRHEFMAGLSATVFKAVQHLIWPSMMRFPIDYAKHIAINVILVSDRKNQPGRDSDQPIMPGWSDLESQFKSLAVAGQTVDIATHRIAFHECELCVSAFTHSLQSHTSNVLVDGLRTQVHQYLDAAQMRDWLEHFDTNFWGLREASFEAYGDEEAPRVVTAFVYDLQTTDILLLDRFHQAVGFDDMVVAVQTQAQSAVVDYSCNAQAMQFDPRDASRPLMASLLETVWGVATPSKRWSPALSDVEVDHLWATTPTPFEYFSSARSFSFAVKDAAARTVVFSDVSDTMTDLAKILGHFSMYEKEIEEVLSPERHLLFIRRWNVFRFKLERAKHFISLNNYNQALYYMRSARHDLLALHDLVHKAMDTLTPVMLCSKEQAPTALVSKPMRLVFLIGSVCAFTLLVQQSYPGSFLGRRLFKPRKLRF